MRTPYFPNWRGVYHSEHLPGILCISQNMFSGYIPDYLSQCWHRAMSPYGITTMSKFTEAQTKWLLFCKWHYQTNSLEYVWILNKILLLSTLIYFTVWIWFKITFWFIISLNASGIYRILLKAYNHQCYLIWFKCLRFLLHGLHKSRCLKKAVKLNHSVTPVLICLYQL